MDADANSSNRKKTAADLTQLYISQRDVQAIDSEIVQLASPIPPSSPGLDDLSDSTDGSYEMEPIEEKPQADHITVVVKNPTSTNIPILQGKYTQDAQGGYWTGKWGMGIGGKIIGTTSDFFYSIKRPSGLSLSSSPISGVYSGYFWMKFNPPRKIVENRMHIIFTLKDGKYTVTGAGSNKLGPYELQGTYDPSTTELSCIRLYKVEPPRVKRPIVRTDSIVKETRSSNRLLSYLGGNTSDVPASVPIALHPYYRLHSKLMHHKWASPFLQPVDPVALRIPDYFDIIKNPMDFGTIETKMKEGAIQTEEEYLSLVRLVFDNAVLYNKPTDDVAIMAKTLSDFFEREYGRLQQIGSMLDGDPSAILTRRRSIKRTTLDSLTGSSQVRQYSLRRSTSSSSSVDIAPKKPVLDLPSDVTETQYCILEQIIGQLQRRRSGVKGKE